ncbi:Imm51 family immunity protein [Kineosporia sp. NBRC 101731]|uniref:Imm51 family immunity protein n=1 Tax=Kineosporia sp. NBRC 101731 TaxID=3032199 RepID=UPI0024A3AB18|nr:Imm51 family immunity protein [Kineosporia sp. NBRC 101731]GLY33587.1 hypothetical protein Kisp02_69520 [Kineosporia sp. NBRC 101731]
MDPLKLIETSPGNFSLIMNAGDTPADVVVGESGHEPNGYFWDGMAKWLVRTQVPEVEGRVKFDPEAGMFCAYGPDREALAVLGTALAAVVNAPDQLPALIAKGEAEGVDFDD